MKWPVIPNTSLLMRSGNKNALAVTILFSCLYLSVFFQTTYTDNWLLSWCLKVHWLKKFAHNWIHSQWESCIEDRKGGNLHISLLLGLLDPVLLLLGWGVAWTSSLSLEAARWPLYTHVPKAVPREHCPRPVRCPSTGRNNWLHWGKHPRVFHFSPSTAGEGGSGYACTWESKHNPGFKETPQIAKFLGRK